MSVTTGYFPEEHHRDCPVDEFDLIAQMGKGWLVDVGVGSQPCYDSG